MKKVTRVFLGTIVALIVMLIGSMTAFAGTWRNNSKGWWYQNDEGTYLINQWFEDSDGQWYYFNQDGYIQTGWIFNNGHWYFLGSDGAMYENIRTPDGYTVGIDGAWLEDLPKYKNVMAEIPLKNKPYWTIQNCTRNNNVYVITANLYDLADDIDYKGDGGEYSDEATAYKTEIKLYFDKSTKLSPSKEYHYNWPETQKKYITIEEFYNIIKSKDEFTGMYLWQFDLDGNYIRKISDNIVNHIG